MSRLAWTDPAPLEVERPRLPWWTLLPRKLLLAVSPVIVVVVLVMVLVFLARRVWRYPLFLIGGTVLAGATAHEISEDTPGVAWAKIDGRRDPDRARAFHSTDADLDELCDYIAAGRHDAPSPLTEIEAA